MSTGPSISGGGSVAVDTDSMDAAARLLRAAVALLVELVVRADALASTAPPARQARITAARALLADARQDAERAEQGLRVAADRYGRIEQANERALGAAFAVGGVERGVGSLLLIAAGGPAGILPVVLLHVLPVAALVAARIPVELATTGRVAPQSDPVLRHALALGLSSLDDEARTFVGRERWSDITDDRPDSFLGTQSIAVALGVLLCHRQGGPIAVTRTTTSRAKPPGSIAALATRLPDGSQPAGQVRIEEYDGPGGRRWIVYSSGTVTFSPMSGREPFDMGSNLLGVGDRTSDSERAVLQAMEQAGIGRDEPVLLVGHSQGALNVVRIAEHGGYDVAGVVQFGGPTGQIALPEDVPVLAVEHGQDVVPALGGIAATGTAGARRLLVTRSLPDLRPYPGAPAAGQLFPAHDTVRYAETTRLAEASADPRMAAFHADVAPFLDGGGTATVTRYHAERVTDRAGRPRTGVAGPGPRPSR